MALLAITCQSHPTQSGLFSKLLGNPMTATAAQDPNGSVNNHLSATITLQASWAIVLHVSEGCSGSGFMCAWPAWAGNVCSERLVTKTQQ